MADFIDQDAKDDRKGGSIDDSMEIENLNPNDLRIRVNPKPITVRASSHRELTELPLEPMRRSASSVSLTLSSPTLTLEQFAAHDNAMPDPTDAQLLSLLDQMEAHMIELTDTQNLTLHEMAMKWKRFRSRLIIAPVQVQTVPIDIQMEYVQVQYILTRLVLGFVKNKLIDHPQSTHSFLYRCRLARLHEIASNVRCILSRSYRNTQLCDSKKPYQMGEWQDQFHPDFHFYHHDAKLTSIQKLLLYLLNLTAQYKLRKQWGSFEKIGETIVLFEQIRVGNHGTHTWRPWKALETFADEHSRYHTNFEQWQQIMVPGVMDAIKKLLRHSEDVRLPFLVPNRYILSFRNGVYNADEGKFYPYETQILPSSVVANRYFDLEFDLNLMEVTHPDDIKIPPLEQIFQMQNIPQDAQMMIMALFGRLFYPINYRDKFRVAIFFLGMPGTGKSTLASFIEDLFHKDDVGTIGNNMEKTFGLSALADKSLSICYDMSEHFPLDHSTMQSMIDGEKVNVPRKNQTATGFHWKGYLMLLSNTIPQGWTDHRGNLLRRLVVIHFENAVTNMHTNLDADLARYQCEFIVKCNLAYKMMCIQWKDKLVYNTETPEYFLRTQRMLAKNVNPLCMFVENTEYVKITEDKNHVIPVSMFQKGFKLFCQLSEWKAKPWKSLSPKAVLEHYKMELVEHNILGVQFTDSFLMQLNPATRVSSSASIPIMQ
jgi:hypothetical protein